MWSFPDFVIVSIAVACVNAQASPQENTILPFNNDWNGSLSYSPPSFPSPWGRGTGDWAEAYRKAREFVSQLDLLEKVNLTTGSGWQQDRCTGNTGSVPRLGFESICMQDSPLGVRRADFVSAFPAGINVGMSWDVDLAYARAYALAEEHRDKGIDVLLGPAIGPLGRAPAAGRNWEGFGPDPYLTGKMGAATVRGTQDAGVIACTKHLVGNEQERFRSLHNARAWGFNVSGAISANIDDRTMHELYMWPFADAVRAGTGSIMCSYNQINNSNACQNSYVMNHLLKNELEFQGFVMSDWQAHFSGLPAAIAGMDMSMPGDVYFGTGNSHWGANMTISVLNGTLPQWRLDDMATRIMAAYFYVGRDSTRVPVNYFSWSRETYAPRHWRVESESFLANEHIDVRGDHASIIRRLGAESTVLLKNTGSTLPLSGKERTVAVFGDDAGSNPWGPNGCTDRACNNGTTAIGWGSGTVDFPYLVTPEQAIMRHVIENTRGRAYTITDNSAETQIVALAREADVGIVFVNANSGEASHSIDGNRGDRNNLTIWENGDRLIENVTSQCNNTIVVIHSVGTVNISSWYDNDNITAILFAGLPGQESGNSIADVLWGAVNPSGRLPFTIARNRADYPADVLYDPNNGQFGVPQQDFSEGLNIDYRHFDTHGIDPIYEFGYGLSYSSFQYSDLVVTETQEAYYSPTEGETGAAPTYGNISRQATDYVFPSNMTRMPLFIYPYLNSTSLANSSNDATYGQTADEMFPPGATNGSSQPLLKAGGAPGGNSGLWETAATVELTVSNTGVVAGADVVQVYVDLGPESPPRVLRGFQKLWVEPGANVTFRHELTRRDLSIWDVVTQDWVRPSNVTIYAGSSSRNLPLSATI